MTEMANRILKGIVLATLIASIVFSQTATTPPGPPTTAQIVANMVAHFTTLLDLTSSQQALATTIFTTQQTALQALQTPMQAAQTALVTAVTSNTGLSAAATQIGSLTAQQVLAQATGDAAFYAILTADQQTKYTELNQPGQGGPGQGPGNGGPGGPGGPPGGPPPKQ
jgi:Spy/CpxP family protein refolding chaperone